LTVFLPTLDAKRCPRMVFSMQDGLKNLSSEAQYNPKLKKLLSGKWGSALGFYKQNHQYKIPTTLSSELGRIGIRVDSKKTEAQILSGFDTEGCLPQKTAPKIEGLGVNGSKAGPGSSTNRPDTPGSGTTVLRATTPPGSGTESQGNKLPSKTTFLPTNPALSRLLGIVGGSSTLDPSKTGGTSTNPNRPSIGIGNLGNLNDLFEGKPKPSTPNPDPTNPPVIVTPDPTPPKPTKPEPEKPKPVKPKPEEPKPEEPKPDPGSGLSEERLKGKAAIFSLDIDGPEDINRSTAEIILRGIGLMGAKSVHKLSYQEALEALHRGKTYQRKPGVTLDSVTKIKYGPEKSMRQMIFEELQKLKEAIRKYPDQPLISKKDDPAMFKEWVENSSKSLTNLQPPGDRRRLMLSLMSRESGQTHWRDFVPITSVAAAVGFGQFLPRTAEGYKINPYDPEQNIKGIAMMLNGHLKTKSLKDALIFYNAGATKPPPQSAINYANAIIKNMKNY